MNPPPFDPRFLPPRPTDFPPQEKETAPVEIDPESEVLDIKGSPSPAPNRLTVVEKVYHQYANHSPFMVPSTYVVPLTVEESPYPRMGGKIREGGWVDLDRGYLGEDAGFIVLQNVTGQYLRSIPTPEEAAELSKHVIEICLSGFSAFTEIPPKESLRLRLIPGMEYSIRSQYGQCEYNLYVFPR